MTHEPWKPTNMKDHAIRLKYIPVLVINRLVYCICIQRSWSYSNASESRSYGSLLSSIKTIIWACFFPVSKYGHGVCAKSRDLRSGVLEGNQGGWGMCVRVKLWESGRDTRFIFPLMISLMKKEASVSFTARRVACGQHYTCSIVFFNSVALSHVFSLFMWRSVFPWRRGMKIQPKRIVLQIKNGASHLSAGTLREISITSKSKPF